MIRITVRKENLGQHNFKKHFKFHNFSEIFYCGITRLMNMILSVFIRNILRNKNMRQSLFNKHSKFQTFHDILYCKMTFRNVKLGVFRQYKKTKTILIKKKKWQNCFKKFLKFQKFKLSSFTLTWSNKGKINGV